METSKKEVHKWLRFHESISTGVMMNKDGKPTANKDDMFNLIREALDKVFKKYSRGEPLGCWFLLAALISTYRRCRTYKRDSKDLSRT